MAKRVLNPATVQAKGSYSPRRGRPQACHPGFEPG